MRAIARADSRRGGLTALHQPAVFERQQDVLEELLGDGVVFGQIADQDRTAAGLARERQHRFQAVFALSGQHLSR
jgi:hypothetical protein